jgi:hypothetical protein
VWFAALGAHVLGHLGRVPSAVRGDLTGRDELGCSRRRLLLIAGAVVIGAVAAVVVLPYGTAWLHWFPADG